MSTPSRAWLALSLTLTGCTITYSFVPSPVPVAPLDGVSVGTFPLTIGWTGRAGADVSSAVLEVCSATAMPSDVQPCDDAHVAFRGSLTGTAAGGTWTADLNRRLTNGQSYAWRLWATDPQGQMVTAVGTGGPIGETVLLGPRASTSRTFTVNTTADSLLPPRLVAPLAGSMLSSLPLVRFVGSATGEDRVPGLEVCSVKVTRSDQSCAEANGTDLAPTTPLAGTINPLAGTTLSPFYRLDPGSRPFPQHRAIFLRPFFSRARGDGPTVDAPIFGPSVPVWVESTNTAGESLGPGWGPVPDLDLDGLPELLVGAPGLMGGPAGTDRVGSLFVTPGQAQTPLASRTPIALPGNALGMAGAVQLGVHVGAIGDTNANGKLELFATTSGSENAVYVFDGIGAVQSQPPVFQKILAPPELRADLTDLDVSSAGDVNLDGYADLAIMWHNENPGSGLKTHRLIVYPGSATGLQTDASVVYSVTPANAVMGGSFAVTDLNADGVNDIVLSGCDLTASQPERCTASLVRVAFDPSPTGQLIGNLANLRGTDGYQLVCPAGDLDGNGSQDLFSLSLQVDPFNASVHTLVGRMVPSSMPFSTASVVTFTVASSMELMSDPLLTCTNVSATGDLSGDGVLDLAIALYTQQTVYLYRPSGMNPWTAGPRTALSGMGPYTLAAHGPRTGGAASDLFVGEPLRGDILAYGGPLAATPVPPATLTPPGAPLGTFYGIAVY